MLTNVFLALGPGTFSRRFYRMVIQTDSYFLLQKSTAVEPARDKGAALLIENTYSNIAEDIAEKRQLFITRLISSDLSYSFCYCC